MIRKLTADELAARPEYVHFLKGLAVGEGGMASLKDEGVGKQPLKGRLLLAAKAAKVTIKFKRSGPDTVVFEVVGRVAG